MAFMALTLVLCSLTNNKFQKQTQVFNYFLKLSGAKSTYLVKAIGKKLLHRILDWKTLI
jgi:hypothetical protein